MHPLPPICFAPRLLPASDGNALPMMLKARMLEGGLVRQLASWETDPPEHPLADSSDLDAFINDPGHW